MAGDGKVKFCIVCGRKIPANSNRHKICGNYCAQRRKALHRQGLNAPYEFATKPPLQSQSLGEINAEARKCGLSYGQYVAQISNRK